MKPAEMARLRLAIFAGVSLAAAAGGAWFLTAGARDAVEAERAAAANPLTLPEGRLKLVSAGMTEARYLALDSLKPAPDGGLQAAVLIVGKTPASLEGGTAMMVKRERIDCAGQRLFEGQGGYFDVDGKLKSAVNFYAAKRGRPVEPGDTEVATACDAARQKGRAVTGFRMAQREMQSPPEGFETAMAQRPNDADGWAWLCTAAAHGRWRPESPGDCDKAVALRPDDTAVRLDRAFLNLTIGRRPKADADFRKVMAEEPGNPAGHFGHGLILAIDGDKAGSRPHRLRGLDLDPDVPEWIEKSYRFFIMPEYRGR